MQSNLLAARPVPGIAGIIPCTGLRIKKDKSSYILLSFSYSVSVLQLCRESLIFLLLTGLRSLRSAFASI